MATFAACEVSTSKIYIETLATDEPAQFRSKRVEDAGKELSDLWLDYQKRPLRFFRDGQHWIYVQRPNGAGYIDGSRTDGAAAEPGFHALAKSVKRPISLVDQRTGQLIAYHTDDHNDGTRPRQLGQIAIHPSERGNLYHITSYDRQEAPTTADTGLTECFYTAVRQAGDVPEETPVVDLRTRVADKMASDSYYYLFYHHWRLNGDGENFAGFRLSVEEKKELA